MEKITPINLLTHKLAKEQLDCLGVRQCSNCLKIRVCYQWVEWECLFCIKEWEFESNYY